MPQRGPEVRDPRTIVRFSEELRNYKLNAHQGFYSRRSGSPSMRYNPNRYYGTIASAGAVWGDRHGPLLHRPSALYFIF